jgi:hypothetical protein
MEYTAMINILFFILGFFTNLVIGYFVYRSKMKRYKERQEKIAQFKEIINQMNRNNISTTWDAYVDSKVEVKVYTKTEVWDTAKSMYDAGDLTYDNFIRVCRLLDSNNLEEAIKIIQ